MEFRKIIRSQMPIIYILGLQTLALIAVAGTAIGSGFGA